MTGRHTGSKLSWVRKSFLPQFSILLFLLWGCAHPAPVQKPVTSASQPLATSFYETVPPGKSLREVSEFFVVDDFNIREMKNRLGAPWEIGSTQTGSFRFKHVSRNALQQKRGSSLSFKASLGPEETVFLKSSLKGLDMSQARAVVFKCRIYSASKNSASKKPFSGRLELTLKDLKEGSQTHDFTSLCLPDPSDLKGWREVGFSRPPSEGIDWEQLKEISISFKAGAESLRTQIGIDEIAFYGVGDVEFQSQRDNLFGFPQRVRVPERKAAILMETRSEPFLYEIARDTWKYFENALDRSTHLPVDHIRVEDPRSVGAYTTPTNLAMYFLACVSAHELGLITKKEAVKRLRETFETLDRMKQWKGFHYNFYSTTNLQVTRNYISAVDSGWLAAAWIVVRQAFPKELGETASRFLEAIDFNEFYDDAIGQIRLGYDEAAGDFSPYHYGLIATEARVTSFIGIGKGDLPREHWWFIYRTPPDRWDWQSQIPQGREVEIERVTFFQGHYTYQGRKFVPSWGGSLFEFLMPTLVIKEKELAPKSFGLNNRVATEVHIDYALNRQGYPVWGLSPASTSSGRLWRYVEYGVKHLGVKGYRDEGVVSPHASILALDTLADQTIDNLRRMLEHYDIYGEYGFYDSVNVRNAKVNPQYLALDQGMILTAITNYLKKGVIKEYFHSDKVGKKAESLLGLEEWFT